MRIKDVLSSTMTSDVSSHHSCCMQVEIILKVAVKNDISNNSGS